MVELRSVPVLVAFILGFTLAPSSDAQEFTVENSSRNPSLSRREYDSFKRESYFITMSDGTRLAADVYRPTKRGKVHARPLPLIWTHDRYQRASMNNGRVTNKTGQPRVSESLRRGYVVADVDVRGGGASFGNWTGVFNKQETRDSYEIIEWFAAQPWCDGNIGMWGGSYLGATQFLAATTGSEHLKAIMPSVAPADLYTFVWMGGIYRDDFIDNWHDLTVMLDTNGQVARVDEDVAGELLRAAIQVHKDGNWNTRKAFSMPHRDSAYRTSYPYLDGSAMEYMDAISESGVAIYHLSGWFDCFTRDTFVLYNNLDNPQRIIMGPWFHGRRGEADLVGEHLSWFDCYLKGVDTGIADQAPIHYYVMGAPEGERWRSASEWPLPEEDRLCFFLVPGSDGGREGTLDSESPPTSGLKYRVDYAATTGTGNRWTNGYGGPTGYPDMAPNDARGLVHDLGPLEEDVEITGHPVVTLWASSTAADGDFYVYLEEVDADGISHYVTEGCLRASHRAVQDAPYDYMDLPYHRGNKEDIVTGFPAGAGPVELVMDLQPTSNLFDAGSFIRITITCADADNADNLDVTPPPEVTFFFGGEHASRVYLPIIPAE